MSCVVIMLNYCWLPEKRRNAVQTEKTETEISRFLILKRTDRFLFIRNRTSLRTEKLIGLVQ